MAKKRRGGGRKKLFKFKLKNSTVYTIFAMGLLLAGGICLLSFTKGEASLTTINAILDEHFGWGRVDAARAVSMALQTSPSLGGVGGGQGKKK